MENKISVIIPCYNAEKTIHVCLNSILKQDYNNYEIIVVDDGSIDKSLFILEKFGNRIILINNIDNKGPSISRNNGIEKASGEIFLFLDADCILKDTDAFRKINNHIVNGEQALVGVQSETPLNDGVFAYFWACYRNYLWEQCDWEYTSAWSLNRGVITKRVWESVGPFNKAYRGADVEDLEYGYRMQASGFRIKICRDIKTINSFPNFYQTLLKIPKRTYLWLFLLRKRKKLDNISTSRASVLKSILALNIVIFLFFNIHLALLFVILFILSSFSFYMNCIITRPRFFILFPLTDIFVHILPFGAIFYLLNPYGRKNV